MKHPTNNAGAWTQSLGAEAEPVKMQKRIGSTTYQVNVYSSDTATETMNDKSCGSSTTRFVMGSPHQPSEVVGAGRGGATV